MKNGRCHKHGGASTGPKTPEGKAASRAAVLKHGKHSLAAREAARLRGEARGKARALTEAYREALRRLRADGVGEP